MNLLKILKLLDIVNRKLCQLFIIVALWSLQLQSAPQSRDDILKKFELETAQKYNRNCIAILYSWLKLLINKLINEIVELRIRS